MYMAKLEVLRCEQLYVMNMRLMYRTLREAVEEVVYKVMITMQEMAVLVVVN